MKKMLVLVLLLCGITACSENTEDLESYAKRIVESNVVDEEIAELTPTMEKTEGSYDARMNELYAASSKMVAIESYYTFRRTQRMARLDEVVMLKKPFIEYEVIPLSFESQVELKRTVETLHVLQKDYKNFGKIVVSLNYLLNERDFESSTPTSPEQKVLWQRILSEFKGILKNIEHSPDFSKAVAYELEKSEKHAELYKNKTESIDALQEEFKEREAVILEGYLQEQCTSSDEEFSRDCRICKKGLIDDTTTTHEEMKYACGASETFRYTSRLKIEFLRRLEKDMVLKNLEKKILSKEKELARWVEKIDTYEYLLLHYGERILPFLSKKSKVYEDASYYITRNQ